MDVSGRLHGALYLAPTALATATTIAGALGATTTPYLISATLASLALTKLVYQSWAALAATGAAGLYFTAALLHKLLQDEAWSLIMQGLGTVLFAATVWLVHKQEFPSPRVSESDMRQHNCRLTTLLGIAAAAAASFAAAFAGTALDVPQDKQNEIQLTLSLLPTALWPIVSLSSLSLFEQIKKIANHWPKWVGLPALASAVIIMSVAVGYAWENYTQSSQAKAISRDAMQGLALALLSVAEGLVQFSDSQSLSGRHKTRRAEAGFQESALLLNPGLPKTANAVVSPTAQHFTV